MEIAVGSLLPEHTGAAPHARSLGRRARASAALALGVLTLGLLGPRGGSTAEAQPRTGARAKSVFEYGCRVQAPQKFLMRRSFLHKGVLDPKKHAAALRYLTERYGRADKDALAHGSNGSALAQAKTVRFMGLPISIHAKIAPALACVEKRIRKTCTGASRYTPRAIGGFRSSNTYRGAEVSNHLFGLAIDIDPDRNACCGCVDPWPNNPICKNTGSVYKRTALTQCWIRSFERFGFDWLGRDPLEDTMHFEFLGDSSRITK